MTTDAPDFLRIVKSPQLVRELAAEVIRDAIMNGALAPGERLVEAALSKRMGVSRPSIREALSQRPRRRAGRHDPQ